MEKFNKEKAYTYEEIKKNNRNRNREDGFTT